jgi:hypothetical protein
MGKTRITKLLCRLLGHDWELTDFRVTHGRLECDRCGSAEWRRG